MAKRSEKTFSKDRAFSLKQNFLVFDQEFDFLADKIRLAIKEELLFFYAKNPASRLTPRMLLACVVDHYRSQQKIPVTQRVLCQKLGVRIYSLHNLRNVNLGKMGIKPYKQRFSVQTYMTGLAKRSI